jgi:hypothetical protein
MAFRTITARFAGACRRCGGEIAVGDTIRFGGRGLTYHLAADCGTTLIDVGYGPPRRVSTAYFPSTGETIYRNARGRCEDAPCCGCCTG